MLSLLDSYSSSKIIAFTTVFVLLLAITTASFSSNAQASGLISGEYSNEEAGVEIVFPAGWTGSEGSTADTVVVTLNPESVPYGQDRHAVALYLSISEKIVVHEPVTNAAPVGHKDLDCEFISTANVNVAGVMGLLTGSSCIDSGGAEYELESVLVNTKDRWIVLSFFAEEELYEAFVDARFAALDTLKVNGAIDVNDPTTPPPAPLEMRTSTEHVIANNETISVMVNSSSSILSFDLDEDNRVLELTTESVEETADGVMELTKISIGRILEGPYVITIDGRVIDEWFVDEATGEPMLWITHEDGAHDIVVQGTNVVPEFSFLGISSILLSIAALIVFGRLRSAFY